MADGRRDGTDEQSIGLALVCALAALAGAVDACGASVLNGLYVSFMSGNTTALGMALGRTDLGRAGQIAAIVVCFVGGVKAGTVLAVAAGRRHLPASVLAVAALLTVPPFAPALTVLVMTFAMGLLNAAMQQAGEVKVSVTYVTGTLVKFGQGIGRRLCGQSLSHEWIAQTAPWFGLLAGAGAAAVSLRRLGPGTLSALPVAAGIVAFAAWSLLPANSRPNSSDGR